MKKQLEIIKINPKDAKAYYNMGVAYEKLKDYENAINSYKKAIKINPNYDKAYYNMGVAYGKLKDYENAINSYKKAIEIDPKLTEYYKAWDWDFERKWANSLDDEAKKQKYLKIIKRLEGKD